MTSSRRAVIGVLLALVGATSIHAHSYKHGAILIGHGWALPSNTNEAQVFVPLVNNGNAADELIAARSPLASLIELRLNNRYEAAVPASFTLEPGKPLPMRPTARHLRVIGLKRPLAIGDSFPLILDFLDAGEIEIEVMVERSPGP